MKSRDYSIVIGVSYLIIFFAAIFANFFVIESLSKTPVETVQQNGLMVRLGIVAFLITVVFDVVVAWALQVLFKEHPLSALSTLFRMMHAAIMGVAIFALPMVLAMDKRVEILSQVDQFNIIWLIGLFFFGIHLILLARILKKPKWICFFLTIAGAMYMLDTTMHFVLPNYDEYAEVFLALVAIPSILGEMAMALWFLIKGGKVIPQAQA